MSVVRKNSSPISWPESDFELGWIVGFLEGEGSFGLQRPTGHNRDIGLRYPRISSSQKEREPLDRLVECFGGKVYPVKWRPEKTEPGWVWCMDGERVADAMCLLLPHMSLRRQGQIQYCLDGEVRRPARGEGNVRAKLSEDDVRAIKGSREKVGVLALRFKVHQSTISKIRSGNTWAHV